MTRPTTADLNHAAGLLEELACNPDLDGAFHALAAMMDMLVWADQERATARREAAIGPGGDNHTIGRHGLNRPVEGRLDFGKEDGPGQRGGNGQPPVEPADLAYKAFRRLVHDWTRELESWRWQWHDQATKVGGWPHRTSQVG